MKNIYIYLYIVADITQRNNITLCMPNMYIFVYQLLHAYNIFVYFMCQLLHVSHIYVLVSIKHFMHDIICIVLFQNTACIYVCIIYIYRMYICIKTIYIFRMHTYKLYTYYIFHMHIYYIQTLIQLFSVFVTI